MVENRALKSDWDYQPKIGSELGHHVKRESENRILFDFISRRNEGSMLICGQRGTGKTSSVFKTINETIEKNSKIIPVLIKATSLNSEDKKSLLQSFIRSLKNQVKNHKNIDDELKTKTSTLYEKAIASKVKKESKSEDETSQTKISHIRINYVSMFSIIAVGILSIVGNQTGFEWIFTDYSLVISIVVMVSAGWLVIDFRRIVKQSSSTTDSNYVLYDYDFSTMQTEFEQLMEDFAEKEYKILFILDELDKTEAPPFEMISNLKMLINQSNVLFIFISDPKALEKINDKENFVSTLFSQILFLKRPLFDEMKTFLDDVIISKNTHEESVTENEDYQNFKNYLCYQAKSGFYDLYAVIRDNIISRNDDGLPMLNIKLSSEQITKSNLQRVIESVYEGKKFSEPSKWQENDKILETLYTACEKLEKSPKLSSFAFEKNTYTIQGGSWSSSNEKSLSSVKDLITTLAAQGYLLESSEDNYQVIGLLPKFDETKGGIFFEEHQKFIKEYKHMLELSVNMANLHNKYLKDLAEGFSVEDIHAKWPAFIANVNKYFDLATLDAHRKIYFNLIGDFPEAYSSDKLQLMTIEVQNGYKEVKKGFRTLLAQIFEHKIRGMKSNQTLGDISRGVMRESEIPNIGFTHSELSFGGTPSHKVKHIVISENIPVDLLDQLTKVTNLNILVITYGDSEDISKYELMSDVNSIDTIQQGLDDLNKLNEDSKKYIAMSLTLPCPSSELDKLLGIL